MKKLLIILLVAIFSCNEPDIDCYYSFNPKKYPDKGEYTCAILNDTLKYERINTSTFEYYRDSLAHCQPNQHLELCE